jgi:hypothetical protein
MNPIDKLKNLNFSNTCIYCPTREEARQIGALIVQLGGNRRDLSDHWSEYEDFVLYLENDSCYGSVGYAKQQLHTIINASEILSADQIVNDYEPY